MERKRVCGIRCRNAKGKRCRCICGGATHGKGTTEPTAQIEQKELPVEVAKEQRRDKMTEHPKVKARAIRDQRDGIWDLWITCPYCHEKHHHGGGKNAKPLYGFRVPHCSAMGMMPDYELVPEK